MNTPFMTSTIGNLTVDSEGLRTAIDEIARLQKIIQEMVTKKTTLNVLFVNGAEMHKTVTLVTTNKYADGSERLYFEEPSCESGKGTEIELKNIKTWTIDGFVQGGSQLLRL